MGAESRCVLSSCISTWIFVELSNLIREGSLYNGWLLTQKLITCQSAKNKCHHLPHKGPRTKMEERVEKVSEPEVWEYWSESVFWRWQDYWIPGLKAALVAYKRTAQYQISQTILHGARSSSSASICSPGTTDSIWWVVEERSHFSLTVWPHVRWPYSREWLHTHKHMGSTSWSWLIIRKKGHGNGRWDGFGKI